jgi:hypothetical protein
VRGVRDCIDGIHLAQDEVHLWPLYYGNEFSVSIKRSKLLGSSICIVRHRVGSIYKVSNVILMTGRGVLWGCEMLRVSRCLENRFTRGGKVVSLTHRPPSAPQKHYFCDSGIHFC